MSLSEWKKRYLDVLPCLGKRERGRALTLLLAITMAGSGTLPAYGAVDVPLSAGDDATQTGGGV